MNEKEFNFMLLKALQEHLEVKVGINHNSAGKTIDVEVRFQGELVWESTEWIF